MRCAWQSYINVLPHWMRREVDEFGRDTLKELRLRIGQPPEMVMQSGSQYLKQDITFDDIHFCMNVASQYSPWSSDTISDGYLTIVGGHRIGLCGIASITNGSVTTLSQTTSLCLRVARDFPEIGVEIAGEPGSTLIIGPPGCGKTTLLRGVIRHKSNADTGAIVVIDERCEVFPVARDGMCFFPGRHTDILSGCGKRKGTEWVIRSMCPSWLALDEITGTEDCAALLHAGWCGVSLIATAHAGNKRELYRRPVYRPILESGIFQNLVIMRPDNSWTLERMEQCS